ncbi:caspase family protein [Streptomyces sp. DH18]|uniref:caspase, EACC1-associated type n=1 Tax=Streptomyces sp. DH18 TaxID=3040126 RepID=UPI0024424CC2|nr:caspase family protein [Streptomyces sp. DH18]MDG9686142.1 caspase family protein [Streptomyces sp. DH18]
MTAPDPAGSRAVFIGVHSAAESLGLSALPAVERNLDSMRRLFTDGTVWTLPDEHCVSIREPGYPHEVLAEVERAAAEATDTLLLYYAGHGLLVGDGQDLHLALRDVSWEDDCLSYAKLRSRLRQGSRARRTVVILDCCYSGQALNGEMGSGGAEGESKEARDERQVALQKELATVVADKADIEGVCVLTASAATRKALSPVGEDYSAFTGELIHVLSHGVLDGAEYLDMTAIYDAVTTRLAQRSGMPVPQFGARGHGADIVLTRNQAHRALESPTSGGIAANAPGFAVPAPERGLPPVLATYKGVEIRDRTVLLQFLQHLTLNEGNPDV